jgi:hypothetical protein
MRILKLVTLALILLCLGCGNKRQGSPSPEYPSIYFTEDQYRTGDTLWYVCYGTCFEDSVERLSFVFFEKGSLEKPPGVRRIVSRTVSHKEGRKTIIDKQEGWLITDHPGTKMTQLPSFYQLNEIQDQKLVVSSAKVTLDQLKSFLDSKPQQYTIEALLSFAKSS